MKVTTMATMEPRHRPVPAVASEKDMTKLW